MFANEVLALFFEEDMVKRLKPKKILGIDLGDETHWVLLRS